MYEATLSHLLNRRPNSHKYQFGHVLILGGVPGMVGAPLLVGEAALRVGAGLVTIASTDEVVDKLERRVVEIMTLRLPKNFGKQLEVIKEFFSERKVSVLVIGPGLEPTMAELVREIVGKIKLPTVVDGGGLTALADHLDVINQNYNQLVLTPHLGEFQRFFREKLPTDRPQLKPLAREFAQKNNLTLVLKGEPTYVASPDGELSENPTGNPGLATAGSGDVLAGIIAGIIGQGIEFTEAIKAAVYIHGLAGDIAAKAKTEPGMIASDIIEAIPDALKTAAKS